jgi:hypothetical protein
MTRWTIGPPREKAGCWVDLKNRSPEVYEITSEGGVAGVMLLRLNEIEDKIWPPARGVEPTPLRAPLVQIKVRRPLQNLTIFGSTKLNANLRMF